MLSVKQMLANKTSNKIWALKPDQTVIEALEMMAEKNIGAVMIMEQDQLVGIFSERDYARKGILKGRKAKSTPLTEVMTAGVITVSPDQTISDCMEIMSTRHFRHLPVMENGRVIGLLSINDIVSEIIREQENRIQSLEQYITGY